MKTGLFILIWCTVFLQGIGSLFGIPTQVFNRGSHEKYDFYKTEGWLQTDHAGSGFHLLRDFTRPNIWVRIFKYDDAVSTVVGLPNNVSAGKHVSWDGASTEENPALKAGDYHRLLERVPFDQELASIDPGSGECSGAGRCYGDWINNDLVWGLDGKNINDKDGHSFFQPEIDGQQKTRYTFLVYVEDNQAFWYKDKNDGYDLTSDKSEARLYFPLSRVIFRITEKSAYNPALDEDLETDYDAYDPGGDEFYMHKKDADLRVESVPTESQIINGRLVYNFQVIHSFQQSSEYVIQIVAEDMERNRRVLRFQMDMHSLGGLHINESSSGGRRTD